MEEMSNQYAASTLSLEQLNTTGATSGSACAVLTYMGTQCFVGPGARQQALRPDEGEDIKAVHGEFQIGHFTAGEYLRYDVNMIQADTGDRRIISRRVQVEPRIGAMQPNGPLAMQHFLPLRG